MSDFLLQIHNTNSEVEFVLEGGNLKAQFRSRISVDLSHLQQMANAIQRVLKRSSSHNGGNREDYEDFMSAVDSFTQTVLPDDVLIKLTTLQGTSLALNLSPALSNLPWELLRIEGECLCLRNGLSRITASNNEIPPASNTNKTKKSTRISIVANPEFNLPAAARESDRLRRMFSRSISNGQPCVWSHRVTPEMLCTAFSNSDWLHFAGHASTHQERTSWRLFDGEFGTSEIISASTKNWPRFVFAHACASVGDIGEPQDANQNITTLAETFLSVGVRHYLGTVVPVLDKDCRQTAESFYGYVLEGEPVAQALRKTRHDLIAKLGSMNLLWACYLLHGPPNEPLIHSTLNNSSSSNSARESSEKEMIIFPTECEVCEKPIRTRHGLATCNDRVVCRTCTRDLNEVGITTIGKVGSIFSNEQQSKAKEAHECVLRFLNSFDQSAKKYKEYIDPSTGKNYPVSLKQVRQERTSKRHNQFQSQETNLSSPTRTNKECRRYVITRPRAIRKSLGQVMDVRILCRDEEITSKRIESNPVGKQELISVLEQLREHETENNIQILASITGWDNEACEFAKRETGTDAVDSRIAFVLVDLVKETTWWNPEDLRLAPLADIFDYESGTEKVNRIIQHIKQGLPLETSLAAIHLATDLEMPLESVKSAFHLLAKEESLLIDEDSEFGLILSQPLI